MCGGEMSKFKVREVLFCLLTGFILISCSERVRFTEQAEAPVPAIVASARAVPPAKTPRAPANTPKVPEAPPEPSQTELCQQFIDSAKSIDQTSIKDFTINGSVDNISIDSARDVFIDSYSGQGLVVKSAISISSILNNSGKIFINAETIDFITNHKNGFLCTVADNIGVIDGVHGGFMAKGKEIKELKNVTSTSELKIVGRIINLNIVTASMNLSVDSIDTVYFVSASSQIRAKLIGTIDKVSAPLHLYEAHVDKVTNNTSIICLHEGAIINNPSGNVSSNCESP